MRSSRFPAVGAALGVIVFASCTLQFPSPRIEVVTEPAYNRHDVLVPYELYGDGAEARAEWILEKYRSDLSEWELIRSRTISAPNGVAGVLPLDLPGDGRYRLTMRLLTSRSGVTEVASGLESTNELYVDTIPPDAGISLDPPPGTYPPLDPLTVTATYNAPPNTDTETPVELFHLVDSTQLPTPDQEPTGDSIVISSGDETFYSHILTIIAVDGAGNQGSLRIEEYRTP